MSERSVFAESNYHRFCSFCAPEIDTPEVEPGLCPIIDWIDEREGGEP